MNQSGKTSAEPPRVESKRERRRGAGAATRAAVLRRAPSDSDCSGETASLSADSGDRLPRHNPPPTRTANARSRRRGSEWEVLEGLKDGQRFEARPDVFNGYLHKKRKWPLKGWHKRFFVIDGGILVYARSAADVARGRLHGSVDVGLSVLSAKARRRRIDIDADEFIYHLRAKTHDVFRTWLNVLKTHRLYRQHLLTFGARESLPKIQAPTDDAPHTDSSSRTSANSSNLSECSSEVKDHIQAESSRKTDFIDKVYNGRYPIDLWQNLNISQDNVRTYESMEQIFDVDIDTKLCQNQCSMCSLKCVSRRVLGGLKTSQYYGKSKLSVNQSNSEAQMATTNLEQTKLSKLTNSLNKNRRYIGTQYSLRDKLPTTACFFFTRKKQSMDCRSVMRRSKKCTNLVKYKNVSEEPPLKQPSSKCMLLSESAFVRSTRMQRESKCKYKMDVIPKTHKEVQIISNRVNQASQNVMTIEDMDEITESLMNKIFKYRKNNEESDNMKYYVDYVVKELYDVKVDLKSNPAKTLFRTLLEFWIRNTTGSSHSNSEFIRTSVKATDVQSHHHLTQDVKISAKTIKCIEKETQYQDMNKTKNPIRCPSENHKLNHPEIRRTETQKDTDSFLKERRIQELERLLKNTVYVCETTRNSFCLDKDIQITKKLLNNLKDHPNYNTRGSDEKYKDKSSSSSEVPQIQDTINNLIQDTALPKDIAKEFLGAYLGILLNDKQGSEESQNTRSSDWSTNSKLKPNVQVMAEPVVKRLSKSVSPVKENAMVDDKSGNVYLRNILQKLTHCPKVVKEKDDKDKQEGQMIEPKDELGRPVKKIEKNNLICEQCDDNSLVVDLSKYNLQEITMVRDPCYKDIVSIMIKLKDKPPMIGESKQPKIVVKLSEQDNSAATNMGKVDYWMTCLDGAKTTSSESLFKALPNVNKPVKEISPNKDTIPLKPYKSEATSKGYIEYHKSDSESSIVSKGSRNNNPLDMTDDDPQCYMMTSFKKCSIPTTFQTKKKVKLKNNEPDNTYNTFDTAHKPEELTIFEKPAPTIIDEKFILLLLENLTLLSKNVPAIYKDINNLFCKLKKKHEKTIKNAANIQGLSLLGKIYNEEYIGTFTKTIATQYDPDALVNWNKEVWTDTAVRKSDKELGTMELRHCVSLQITLDGSKYYENMIEVASTSKDIEHHDRKIGINESTSVPYWLNKMLTKECAINTLLKYALDNENTNKFSKFFARPITNVDDTKKYLDKFKHVLWKEIMFPIPRVSTHAQTDKRTRLNTVMHDMEYMNKGNKNFDVYTMHWTHNSGHTSSMTLTDVSDDLKTIYRCISEPSYHSG